MSHSEKIDRLFEAARRAARQAYAPYSKFHVGAALLTKSDQIFVGCNVENSSFGLTICAERSAVFRAVVEGEREYQAIAIVSPLSVSPCGACRQVLVEFAPQLEVWYGALDPSLPVFGPISLDRLLPNAMTFEKS